MMTMKTRRTTTSISESYFKFLYNIIRLLPHKYYKLAKELHNVKYVWIIPNDENRASDGRNLRDEFIYKYSLDPTHLEVNCLLKADSSVFEMLVALAKRMNYELLELDEESDKTNVYFHELLTNLKLDVYEDGITIGSVFPRQIYDDIQEILDTFMNRKYDAQGNGSPFPLSKSSSIDMRGIETWYQMMVYIEEKYG